MLVVVFVLGGGFVCWDFGLFVVSECVVGGGGGGGGGEVGVFVFVCLVG